MIKNDYKWLRFENFYADHSVFDYKRSQMITNEKIFPAVA